MVSPLTHPGLPLNEVCIPENSWFALQVLDDAYPEETRAVLGYLVEVTHELASMTEFLCEQFRDREIDQEWQKAKNRIKMACSVLGLRGEKILANCGPEMKALS
jgi:hypothetical protein